MTGNLGTRRMIPARPVPRNSQSPQKAMLYTWRVNLLHLQCSVLGRCPSMQQPRAQNLRPQIWDLVWTIATKSKGGTDQVLWIITTISRSQRFYMIVYHRSSRWTVPRGQYTFIGSVTTPMIVRDTTCSHCFLLATKTAFTIVSISPL